MTLRTYTGTFGNDILTGDAGNNTIEGGAGADIIAGGAGTDTASYQHSSEGVHVSLASAPGFVGALLGGSGSGGDAEGDRLYSIENVTGSGYNDWFSGNSANNTFDGGAGIDRVSYQYATQGVDINLSTNTVTDGGLNVEIRLGPAWQSVGTDTLVNIEQVEGSRFDDTFHASNRHDTFVFGNDIGNDTINGFNARNNNNSHDVIRFEGVFEDWNDLRDHIERDGNDYIIHIDDNNSITLNNVNGNLDANDFVFA